MEWGPTCHISVMSLSFLFIIHIDVSGLLLQRLATRKGTRIQKSRNFCLWNPITGNFRFWILESWPLQSGKQLKESGIHLKIGIRNQRSTDKVGYLESEIHGLESRIQACLVFPYIRLLFNAGRYLFRFRRLRYCGKQRKLLEDFKKLAVSCVESKEVQRRQHQRNIL